ncbi:MAG: hypothetical protein ACRDC6_22730 [Shewanella sp.]
MNLTEGQLFTIEALNKIDGFVWPEKANHAFMNENETSVSFSSDRTPEIVYGVYNHLYVADCAGLAPVKCKHPDWSNSLITREQFDSVDGWVRNDGNPPVDDDAIVETIVNGEVDSRPFPADGIEWGNGGCVSHWRYPKPTKESKMQPEAPKQPSIDDIYSQYKAQRGIVESAKKTLADEMEVEDKLLEQIKAWNLEHGFDVRLLDESEEKPELVITDWRDLRVGDVIWWSGDSHNNSGEYAVYGLELSDYKLDCPICVKTGGDCDEWIDTSSEEWKFIRRP